MINKIMFYKPKHLNYKNDIKLFQNYLKYINFLDKKYYNTNMSNGILDIKNRF